MSWSLMFGGSQPQVQQWIADVAPQLLANQVSGTELTLAQQALTLASATVNADSTELPMEITVSGHGSAFIDPQGTQLSQSLSITINSNLKPTP